MRQLQSGKSINFHFDADATTFQSRQDLMLSYISERVGRAGVRVILYTVGCLIAYFAVNLKFALIAYAICLTGDALETTVLKFWARRVALRGNLKLAQRLAVAIGAVQGLSLAFATTLYFFQVENPNILFVIGALGLGAVNSAIVLPKNPTVAVTRLALYGLSPLLFMSVRALQTQDWNAFKVTDETGLMLLFCMAYMFFAFSKSGFDNFRVTQDLARNRAELNAAIEAMHKNQSELRQLSLVARNANDSVIISDAQRNILWVNDAFSEVTGFSLDEVRGKQVCDVLRPVDPNAPIGHFLDQAVKNGMPFRGVVQNVYPSGNTAWVDVNLSPVHDPNGKVEFYISIERDISEAKEHAQEMAKARKAAEQGAKAKADFLANMSHEIRTPLSGVIGMADLLAETDLSPEQVRYTDTIRGSSLALVTIINDILDLSKLDAGQVDIHPVNFSPANCFQETVDLLRPNIEAKGLAVELEIDESTPNAVKADDGRIRQVLTNILGNAAKFTTEGSITIRLRCDQRGGDQTLIFEVQDTGIGIAQDKQAQIFDHFTQAEVNTTRKFGGSGLGLSISRHIVNVMGGSIGVASELGQGSVFTVSLPVSAADVDHVPATRFVSKDEIPTLQPGLRILIAEDNSTSRFLLGKYLKDQPVSVEFAEDGVQAVEMVWTGDYDLIFMDMSMPRMTGIEATLEIRKMQIDPPAIVALTAHAFETEMEACFAAGMDDFLTKPIRKLELLNWLVAFQAQTEASVRPLAS